MNRLIALVVLLSCLGLASCSKDKKDTDGLPASIQAQIDNNKACICLPYIDLLTWKGREVYLLGHKGPTCNTIPVYYNRKGEEIRMHTGYTLDQFLTEAQLVKHIWSCEP
jgi:hypothetical protein